jgi:pyridoxal biosynthesis lyase PdxS
MTKTSETNINILFSEMLVGGVIMDVMNVEQAKIAAMNTKWQSDASAAETQVGKIIYNFKLTQ